MAIGSRQKAGITAKGPDYTAALSSESAFVLFKSAQIGDNRRLYDKFFR